MSTVVDFWGQLLQVQAAALPASVVGAVWLRLGWALVLGALAAVAVAFVGPRWGMGAGRTQTLARALALLAMLWCALPGEVSPAFWLGLAFQAPSLSLGLVGALVLVRQGAPAGVWPQRAAMMLAQMRAWAGLAVLLGWVLLLDTLAVWPWALYPLGFGVLTWLVLLALVGLPWAWRGGAWHRHGAAAGWVLVLLAFALLRLPSGNVWDAVLDPWLWLAAHVLGVKAVFSCYKNRS